MSGGALALFALDSGLVLLSEEPAGTKCAAGGQRIVAGIDRDELFLTSKLRTKYLGEEEALAGIKESLARLGTDYLDMFLIHWPAPSQDRFVETWRAFVQAREDGLTRSIGVSLINVSGPLSISIAAVPGAKRC